MAIAKSERLLREKLRKRRTNLRVSRDLGPWKSAGRASPFIFSIGLAVDQAYSQFLFREEVSPILPLIYM